jgi:hypothetical protein
MSADWPAGVHKGSVAAFQFGDARREFQRRWSAVGTVTIGNVVVIPYVDNR